MAANTIKLPSFSKQKRGPFAEVKRGSVIVKIYSQRNGRGPFTIAWHDPANKGRRRPQPEYLQFKLPLTGCNISTDNPIAEIDSRMRAMRSTLPKAKFLAEEKATALANGESAMLAFTQADRASYLCALESLAPTGKSLELAAADYAACISALPAGASLQEAVRFFASARTETQVKTVPEIARLFAREKEADMRISDRWRKTLGDQISLFAKYFQCPFGALRAHQINQWLRDLPVKIYTRRHYRAAIVALVKFAKQNNFLSRQWNELDYIPIIEAESDEEIIVLPPKDLRLLLHHTHDNMIPFTAIGAFAEVRNAEIQRLQWPAINLEARNIFISKKQSKTGKKTGGRNVPISDNLAAWLAPHWRPSGPICTLSSPSDALCEAKKRAGIAAGKNMTRNTLRKSAISYQLALGKSKILMAKEAGTSEQKIDTNYNAPVSRKDAEDWYAIYPTSSDVIQLNFALA